MTYLKSSVRKGTGENASLLSKLTLSLKDSNAKRISLGCTTFEHDNSIVDEPVKHASKILIFAIHLPSLFVVVLI